MKNLGEIGRIYETAIIPASERKPTDRFQSLLTHPHYRTILATRDPDHVIGFALCFAPPDAPFALLEYLAVDQPARGAGVGAALFRATMDMLAHDRPPVPLLIEVEAADDDDGADPDKRRRQAFYRRLGCRRVAHLAYELPLRTAGTPPPMHLFAHLPPAAPPLRRADLETALRRIYAQVYDQPATDPRIDRMLQGVADPVELT